MTLDEKRRVIEVLLCAGAGWRFGKMPCATTLVNACDSFADYSESTRAPLFDAALKARRAVAREGYMGSHLGEMSPYAITAVEAAYRLISSSPQLRREFFGRGAK